MWIKSSRNPVTRQGWERTVAFRTQVTASPGDARSLRCARLKRPLRELMLLPRPKDRVPAKRLFSVRSSTDTFPRSYPDWPPSYQSLPLYLHRIPVTDGLPPLSRRSACRWLSSWGAHGLCVLRAIWKCSVVEWELVIECGSCHRHSFYSMAWAGPHLAVLCRL